MIVNIEYAEIDPCFVNKPLHIIAVGGSDDGNLWRNTADEARKKCLFDGWKFTINGNPLTFMEENIVDQLLALPPIPKPSSGHVYWDWPIFIIGDRPRKHRSN